MLPIPNVRPGEQQSPTGSASRWGEAAGQETCGMGWDGMGWDGMGWDGMGWDGMGWGTWNGIWGEPAGKAVGPSQGGAESDHPVGKPGSGTRT